MPPPEITLVISTLGRADVFQKLFKSLEKQTRKTFDVVVVDQNEDDRVSSLIDHESWSFPITHIRRPQEKGLSRGRNEGLKYARGAIILFPDDDCWYPSQFMETGVGLMEKYKLDIVGGRCTDDFGRSINARFSKKAHFIDRQNVWVSNMEAYTFFRRSTLNTLRGFDEELGIGAATPWQAAEGTDIIIRAINIGMSCYFDPALYGHHIEIDLKAPNNRTINKTRAYARGMGFVLRKHNYHTACIGYWLMRPLFNTIRNLASGNLGRARFYFAVAQGRLEGWRGKVGETLDF